MDPTSAQLVEQWTRGDQTAADELFRRYVGRLTALARGRISRRLGRRIDPEDVAHSAYRSFFIRARTGEVTVTESGDLWRLLVAIALNKVRRQAQHHRADKRSIDREERSLEGADVVGEALRAAVRLPTAEEAASLAEEFELFLAELSPLERRVLELRMQDRTQIEIATQTGRTERTVRRILTRLQGQLEQRLLGADSSAVRAKAMRVTTDDDGVESDESPDSDSSGASEIRERVEPKAAARRAIDDDTFPDGWLRDDEFQLARFLGAGGSGKVYEAWWRSRNEWVAVKVLKKRSQADTEAVARFLHEAVAVEALEHPGIVPFRGVGRLKSGGYFLVFDLVRGGDLSSLAAAGRPSVDDILGWVADAALAVDHAHRHGVIHCDLKPSNLLLGDSGKVRVTDFGLAHLLQLAERPAGIGGTVGFMAPEQIERSWGPIGPHTDIFGLGGVLFALTAGKPPFSGTTCDEVVDQLFHDPVPSLKAACPDVDDRVDALCRRCLARRIDERFRSAAELAEAAFDLRIGISNTGAGR